MISRLFLTLIFASSLTAAAQETKPTANSQQEKQEINLAVFVQSEQKELTNYFSKVALTAAVITTGLGLAKGSPGLTGCGLGLTTGLACAAYETKPNSYLVLPWLAEVAVRATAITIINVNSGICAEAAPYVLLPMANGARVGSWISYLGYHIARRV